MRGGSAGIDSHRYGSCALWVLEGDLAGSGAVSFSHRVAWHFRAGERALVVDLRHCGLVDSIGAAALADSCSRHRGMRLVGRPAGWSDLPLPVRRSLLGLCPAPDLETALAAALPPPPAAEQRRHPRIPLQLPVELFVAGRRAPAALRDISRGGVHLCLLPEAGLETLLAGRNFGILGMSADPLAREIIADRAGAPVYAAPVHLAAGAACGARFFGSPPPV